MTWHNGAQDHCTTSRADGELCRESGIGMPDGIADSANEEEIIDLFTISTGRGVISEIAAEGQNSGAASNTQAVKYQPQVRLVSRRRTGDAL